MRYTVRAFKEDDWVWMTKLAKQFQLHANFLKSENAFACVVLDKDTPVAFASGMTDTAPDISGKERTDRTSRLGMAHAMNGREDALLCAIEWLNATAIKMGQQYSVITLPCDPTKQCTNVYADVEAVDSTLAARPLEVAKDTKGLDVEQKPVEVEYRFELKTAGEDTAKHLDALGCEREWL